VVKKIQPFKNFLELRPEFPGTGSEWQTLPERETKNQKENIYEKTTK